MKRAFLIGLVLVGCGDKGGSPTPPPAPEPHTVAIKGEHIDVEATIAKGSRLDPKKVEAAVRTAVEILERD